jgi:hypothetical protein
MLQARDHLGLGAKTGQDLWTNLGSRQDHLQRYGSLQSELPGLEDDAHAAAAQLPQDFVALHGRPFGLDAARPEVCGAGRMVRRLCCAFRRGVLQRQPHPLQTAY